LGWRALEYKQETYNQYSELKGVQWIRVVQVRTYWWAVMNTVMNIPGSLMRKIQWSPELRLSGKT